VIASRKFCTVGCPKTKRSPSPPKFIEAKIEAKQRATCVGRNGVFDIEAICLDEVGDGSVQIGFVSRRLHRRVNAGAVIPAESMDKLATEWIRRRGSEVQIDDRKVDLRAIVTLLKEVTHDIDEIVEEI
jgi:hypothetical protein